MPGIPVVPEDSVSTALPQNNDHNTDFVLNHCCLSFRFPSLTDATRHFLAHLELMFACQDAISDAWYSSQQKLRAHDAPFNLICHVLNISVRNEVHLNTPLRGKFFGSIYLHITGKDNSGECSELVLFSCTWLHLICTQLYFISTNCTCFNICPNY